MKLAVNRENWTNHALGLVARNVNEFYHHESHGDLPYVAGPHVDPGRIRADRFGSTSDETFPPTFKRLFRSGDVLLHSRGIEKLAVVDRTGVTGEKLFVIRTLDEDVLDQRFLPWLLMCRTSRKHMEDNFTGSVNKFLNWRPLAELQVKLPPISEQKRISDLLWAVDDHRLALEQVQRAINVVAEREADEALGDLAETDAVPGAKAFTDISVGVVVRPSQYYTDGADGVPALRGVNIAPGGFEFDMTDLVRFRPDAAASLPRSTLRVNDVVVVRSGRPGDAAVVTEDIAGANCIDLIIVRPSDDLDPHFLAYLLNSSFGRRQVAKRSAGTAQQHFNLGALKKMDLPLPDLSRQRAVTELLADIRAAGRSVRESIAETSAFSGALLDEIIGARE